jgi:hypothetical protein
MEATSSSEKEKKAKVFVASFRKEFFRRFGATPKVEYTFSKIPLEDIELACSGVLNRIGLQHYEEGIRTSIKDPNSKLCRQIFYYLAQKFGHEGVRAARFLKQSGPLAGYSANKIEQLLKLGNEEVIRITAKIKEELSIRYSQII